jgi:lipid II:glycine glycyltransferase (peptidoglycan interpeptide bridge formation enzyme)
MQPNHFTPEIDRVSQADWHKHLEKFSDANLYQTLCYGAVRWGEKNLSRIVFKNSADVLGIAQLRIVRTPVIGSGIAYLRWGPLFEHGAVAGDENLLREMIAALQKEFAEKQGHALRILPNAFVGTARAKMFETVLTDAGFKPAEDHEVYRTMLVDLAPSLEDIRRKFDQKWRNQLNQSERNNLVVSQGTDAASWNSFEALYRDMMLRKQFDTTVSIEEFAEIQNALPENFKMCVFIATSEGESVAGIACSFIGDTVVYLLGATNEKALKVRAANLLQWEAIKKAKQLGAHFYDLGGIDPEANPGGFHFKQGLGGTDVSHLPAYDFYRSSGQRLMLNTTFKAASALRAWKVRRNKTEAAAAK